MSENKCSRPKCPLCGQPVTYTVFDGECFCGCNVCRVFAGGFNSKKLAGNRWNKFVSSLKQIGANDER